MKPKAFNFYLDYLENIEDLSDEQIGVLTRALLIYANTGEIIEMELAVKQTFKPIKKQMDIEFENYTTVSEKRKEAGKKGGRPSAEAKNDETETAEEKANGFSEKAKKANGFLGFDEKSKKSKSIENENENENENNNNSFVQNFNEFWSAYPKKRNKPDAERAFKKLKVDESLLSAMLNALKKHKKLRQWQDKQYIPNPATWLNGHMWEDEITKADITPPNKYTGSYLQRDENYDDMSCFDFIDKMSGLDYIDEMDKE